MHFRAASIQLNYDAGKTVSRMVTLILVIVAVTVLLPIVLVAVTIFGAFAAVSSSSPPRTTVVDDDGPTKPSKRSTSKSGSLSKVCRKAVKCCRIAMGKDDAACDSIAQAGLDQVCAQAMDAFRSTAEAKGKRCK